MPLFRSIVFISFILTGVVQPALGADWSDDQHGFPYHPNSYIVNAEPFRPHSVMHSLPNNLENLSVNLLDTAIYQVWMNDTWTNSGRHSYYYDNGYRQIELAYDWWRQLAWTNRLRYFYHWNTELTHIDSIVIVQTDGNTWINTSKETFTYDQLGQELAHLYQQWEPDTWVNHMKFSSTYDSLGRIETYLFLVRRNQQFENYEFSTYSYAENGMLSEVLYQRWYSDAWRDSKKDQFLYDSTLRPIEILRLKSSIDSWGNYHRLKYSYTEDYSIATGLWEYWINESWEASIRLIWHYNSLQLLSEFILQRPQADQWIDSQRRLYEYGTGQSDVNSEITTRPVGFALKQNAPNPFNPSTIIKYSVERKSHIVLTVFNLLGQRIRTLVDELRSKGSYSAEWNGKDETGDQVASGLYFYRIQVGSKSASKKMILLK